MSLEIPPGEILGIIGRNGAGKTTLLKVLSRITEPTEGRVTMRGRVGSLLEVGTGFHQELTGRENIYLNGAILGMSRREVQRRFEEIVAFAEIEPFLDTPLKRYSTGMGTRLAFAVAAHLETDILLVDEVLAVGDMGFRKKCLGKMQDVTQAGRTVLFVSHDMNSVRRLCQSAVWLDQGRVRARGPVREVVHQYEADFLGPEGQGWPGWSGRTRPPPRNISPGPPWSGSRRTGHGLQLWGHPAPDPGHGRPLPTKPISWSGTERPGPGQPGGLGGQPRPAARTCPRRPGRLPLKSAPCL